MAMGGPGGGGHVRGRRRPRKRPLSEINVTPLVDVMLVLLIIFMISAPLLTVAVPVDLPETEASAVESTQEPVTVSINSAGTIFVGEREVAFDSLIGAVLDDGGTDARDRPLFLRADAQVPYQAVARVMARLSTNGFAKLNLITDTAGNAAEAEPVEGDL